MCLNFQQLMVDTARAAATAAATPPGPPPPPHPAHIPTGPPPGLKSETPRAGAEVGGAKRKQTSPMTIDTPPKRSRAEGEEPASPEAFPMHETDGTPLGRFHRSQAKLGALEGQVKPTVHTPDHIEISATHAISRWRLRSFKHGPLRPTRKKCASG